MKKSFESGKKRWTVVSVVIYIFIFSLVGGWCAYSLNTFEYRYRRIAAERFADSINTLQMPTYMDEEDREEELEDRENAFSAVLENLGASMKDIPGFKPGEQGEAIGNTGEAPGEGVEISRVKGRLISASGNLDAWMQNAGGVGLLLNFVVFALPFGVLAVFSSLALAVASDFIGGPVTTPLAKAPPVLIESVPAILVLLMCMLLFSWLGVGNWPYKILGFAGGLDILPLWLRTEILNPLAGSFKDAVTNIKLYVGFLLIAIPFYYRPLAGVIKDLKHKNVVNGLRLDKRSEIAIIRKLIFNPNTLPLLISQVFFFLGMSMMLETCLNFLTPFSMGETIPSFIGQLAKYAENMSHGGRDLGRAIVSGVAMEMKSEMLMVSGLSIVLFIMGQMGASWISAYIRRKRRFT